MALNGTIALTPRALLITGLGLLLLTFLLVGIYHDPEFYQDRYLFLKYRPALQLDFYSPVGESDKSIKALPTPLQQEELAYREYISKRGVLSASSPLRYWPLILIQAVLTFMAIGLYAMRNNQTIPLWKVLLHFVLCLIPSAAGTYISLNQASLLWSLLSLGALVLVNSVLAYWILRKRRVIAATPGAL